MVIITGAKQKRPGLPSKRPFGTFYESIKYGLKTQGYYDKYDLKRYDPGYYHEKYVSKYYYKPRKRLAGYLGQELYGTRKKKKLGVYKYRFQQKYSEFFYCRCNGRKYNSESCYRCRQRREYWFSSSPTWF